MGLPPKSPKIDTKTLAKIVRLLGTLFLRFLSVSGAKITAMNIDEDQLTLEENRQVQTIEDLLAVNHVMERIHICINIILGKKLVQLRRKDAWTFGFETQNNDFNELNVRLENCSLSTVERDNQIFTEHKFSASSFAELNDCVQSAISGLLRHIA